MRKKEYLRNPSLSTKEYEVLDFSKITDYATNVVLSDKVSATDITLKFVCESTGIPIKTFFIANRFFMYRKDNYLYEFYNKRLNLVLSKKTQPLMIDVIIEGKREILIIESTTAYILKKNLTFSFPYGTCIAKYDGRIFVANGKNLYFSNVFNFTEYSTNIENVGFFSVNDEDGDISELIDFQDCLFVVCKNAIYKLKITNQEDFSFIKCQTDYLDILVGSAKKVGEEIYFVSQNKLCVFNGNSFKKIDGDFDRFLPTATESATTSEGRYSIKVFINSEPVFLVYDTFTGKYHYTWTDGGGIVAENGHVFVTQFGTLYKIASNKNMHVYRWCSKELDFSTTNKKRLMELRLTVDQPMLLTIKGDFGIKKVQLVEGLNVKKLSLISRKFKFSVCVEEYKFLIKDMKFKYRILGE